MKLSRETSRQCWLVMILVWVTVAGLAFGHAKVTRDYLEIVGQLGLRGAAPSTPLSHAFPAFALDAQTWVRHALSLIERDEGGYPLRYTTLDNAPTGREVHWHSAWAWTIALAGLLDHRLTGTALAPATERMILWLNPFVLVVLTIALSAWAAGRAGALAGSIVAIAAVGHPRIYEGFIPSYVDHHGLLTMSVFAMALGTCFMGAGWWREQDGPASRILPISVSEVRLAAIFSALGGALGLWISAASVIPSIALLGSAGMLVLLAQGRAAQRAGMRFEPNAWRLWGRVGGAASLGFYLLEYFPHHMGLRLEVNHPVYAAGWWGGGELIALVGEQWLGYARLQRRHLAKCVLPLGALALAPLAILMLGNKAFVLADPFLTTLHGLYTKEFLPLWSPTVSTGEPASNALLALENAPLFVGLGALLITRHKFPIALSFITLGTLFVTVMGLIQARWLLNASGLQVCLSLGLLGYFTTAAQPSTRWLVGLSMALIIFAPQAVLRVTRLTEEVRALRVSSADAYSALYRDLAMRLRAAQPEGEIVLLTSPNGSTAIGYYGRFQTLGTLYWENLDGLKAAAAIFAAATPEAAVTLIREHRITHLAIIKEENFIEPYYRLLHPHATTEDVRACFGYQLLRDKPIPSWLQPIPYTLPSDLAALDVNVLLFKVDFDQTPTESLYHAGLAKLASGALADAERDFDALIKQSPADHQPYFRKGELLFSRQEWAAAADFMIAGIARAPASEQVPLTASAAGGFYHAKQHRQVVQIYEALLAARFDAEIAAFLAFVLATSAEDAVRDGSRALALAQSALHLQSSSTVLNALAASLAETGSYREAAAAAARALASAQAAGSIETIRVTQKFIESYQAGRPWRD